MIDRQNARFRPEPKRPDQSVVLVYGEWPRSPGAGAIHARSILSGTDIRMSLTQERRKTGPDAPMPDDYDPDRVPGEADPSFLVMPACF
jgi:hypothetical protein